MSDFTAVPGNLPTAPPPLTPPRVSLLTAADVVNDLDELSRGFNYAPESCDSGTVSAVCYEPGTFTKEPLGNPSDPVLIDPFVVLSMDQCSAWSFRDRDFYGRAERNLLANESKLIEQEFMSNTLSLTNPYVLNAANTFTTATPSAVTALRAFALVEQAASETFLGRFMIHVRPLVLDLLVAARVIRREGNVWLSPLDNIVVPGRGYPGTGPAGEARSTTSEWIYATAPVQIRRGPIVLLPEPVAKSADNPQGIAQSAVTRATNDISVIAERLVSVAFDPSCGVIAGQVNPSL